MLSQEQIKTNKENFINLLKEAGTLNANKTAGIEKLISYLESSDFFVAPASTNYHQNYDGGLCEHSLGVFKQLEKLVKDYNYEDKISRYSVIITALLHDLCKVNFYEKVKKKLPKLDANGKEIIGSNGFKIWEMQEAWETKKGVVELGHSAKSLFLIQHFIMLSEQEAEAIYNHMSMYDLSNYHGEKHLSSAYAHNKLAYLLVQADMNDLYLGEFSK